MYCGFEICGNMVPVNGCVFVCTVIDAAAAAAIRKTAGWFGVKTSSRLISLYRDDCLHQRLLI